MSTSFTSKINGLSPVERLKVTDKYLTEMRGILAQMDEIREFRAENGAPDQDGSVGGYKRSSVVNMIAELEKQKEAILSELAEKEKKAETALSAPASKTEEKGGAPAVAAEKSPTPKGGAVANFMGGDNALAIESMYTGISMDIEKMRSDILQEMKYTYKQDMAIYDDLSEKIEAIKQIDMEALEEKLRPLYALASLAQKLDSLQPLDYDLLAQKVSERIATGNVDYDVLAEKIAAAAEKDAADQSQASIESKLDEMQRTLNGAVSVKQMPEFKRLDALISEYLKDFSYDFIPDILVTAEEIKDIANRYIVSGNTLRGETMLSDLRLRLTRVNVWGASALAAVRDAISSNKLPMMYSEEAYQAFSDASAELEQAPALADDEIAGKVARTKDALFNDADQRVMDAETLDELASVREEIGETAPGEDQVAQLTELKKELMSFNLSYFIDFAPALPEEKTSSSVDTEAILSAIRKLGTVQPAAPQETQPIAESGKIADLAAGKANVSVKKARVLRPAVSAKDNKTEKTEQPLRTVRRSIRMSDDNPDALSKKIVEELALKIANSRVR